MEAYYHRDPRIEEWVEQIIEKIFTTCLLGGIDSEAEYQKGCQIVEKLTSLLQGFSTFPSEYLADGIKQIIEQQLPDSRVINNFPTFNDTMNQMLYEGMFKVINIKNNVEVLISDQGAELGMIAENQKTIPALASIFQKEIETEELQENKILGKEICKTIDTSLEHKEIIIRQEDMKVGIEADINSDTCNNDSHKTLSIPSKVNELKTIQVPNMSERLNDVLCYLFPKATVLWNITLHNQKFLAQVEDILIYCYDPARPCKADKFIKDGWRILVLQEDDLSYPRRIEREIKNIVRLGKKSNVR